MKMSYTNTFTSSPREKKSIVSIPLIDRNEAGITNSVTRGSSSSALAPSCANE